MKEVTRSDNMRALIIGVWVFSWVLFSGGYSGAQTVKNAVNDQAQIGSAGEINSVTNPSAASSAPQKAQGSSFLTARGSNAADETLSDDAMPPSERLARALWNATTQTSVFAKEVGNSIADYVKEKQNEKEQQELVDRFYYHCRQLMVPLRLSPLDHAELMRRVELVYIEDGEKGGSRLDTRTFRDLPNIIKKEHGDMVLERVRDGEVKTYYPNGAVRTVWRYQAGKPEGSIVTYYENGEILTIDVYKNGQKVIRRKYDQEGKLEFEQPYSYTEETQKPADVPSAVVPVAPAEASVPPAGTVKKNQPDGASASGKAETGNE